MFGVPVFIIDQQEKRTRGDECVPLFLALMGLPFPGTFDGRVLHELFANEPVPEQKLIAAGKSAEGSVVSAKLKNLHFR